MDFGRLSLSGPLTASSIPMYQNFVKQIIFRAGSLLLQFFVVKICSLLAWGAKTFTSVLMFTEDPIQRAIFVKSRGFSRSGLIVLLLTIFMVVGNFFDTLLWALDSPGYILHKADVSAATITDHLLPEPGYLVYSSSSAGDIVSLDGRLVSELGVNLFQPGVNFSLTGQNQVGTPKTTPPTLPFKVTGPRIWLDDQGFSVSITGQTTFSSSSNNVSDTMNCPWMIKGRDMMEWNCTFDNIYALELNQVRKLGLPEVHWDDTTDAIGWSQYIQPTREDNPWTSLSTGGDTAAMKQMFTVTKGNKRHTFIETAVKVSLLTDQDIPFARDQVEDAVNRHWSSDPTAWSDSRLVRTINSIMNAMDEGKSGQYGYTIQDQKSVSQVNYELLTPDVSAYTLLRNTIVNITLVRSDDLPAAVTPFESCDSHYYSNIALGGRVRETDCYKSQVGNYSQEGARFLGQLDTSTVLILNGVLGDGRSNISAIAFNQTAWTWFWTNYELLDDLVMSRGGILALGPETVTVQITSLVPAVSPLQLLLIALAALFAGLAWLGLTVFADPHYSNTLFANLIATTFSVRDGDATKSLKPGYVHDCPDVKLSKNHGVVALATSSGVFRHVQVDEDGAMKRLIERNPDSSDSLMKSPKVEQTEVYEQSGLGQQQVRGSPHRVAY